MTRQLRSAVLCVALCIGLETSLLSVSVWAAEQTKPVPAAPIPAQILAAKKVFVANAGAEQRSYEDPLFNGRPERTYNQFYAAMKTWGRYELVSAPADADLLFEIGLRIPAIGGPEAQGAIGGIPFDPQFRLEIRDPKTNALLWAFTEHAQWAILQGNRERNFDQTLTRIVSDLQGLMLPANRDPESR
jgi:hypothetical protein